MSFSWSSSTNQSTSTTPSVFSKMSRICRAMAILARGFRSVDLRHQGAQDRRSGRDLGHLDTGAVPVADGLEPGPQPLRDIVALGLALSLCREVHLDIGHGCCPLRRK